MSEDELIEEFTRRVRKLAYRAVPNDPEGHFIFRGKGYTAFRASEDANYPHALGVLVYFGGTPLNIFWRPVVGRPAILVEDYEAEEVLERMRQDMVLDELADV